MIGNDYYYLDNNDRILKKNEESYTDAGSPIGSKFRTPWYQVGAVAGFQRIYNAVLQGKLISEHGIKVEVFYDFEDAPRETFTYVTGRIPADWSSLKEQYPIFQIRANEQIRIQPRFQKCQSVSFAVTEFLPRGYIPNGGIEWYGVRLEIGLKSGAYRFDESKAMASLLSS
jgi:hypothetical protein